MSLPPLATALCRRGWRVTLLERGQQLCSSVRAWGHVTLFSPNALNMTAAGRAALRELGLTPPAEEAFPTGDELVDSYLAHIGTFLQQVGRSNHSYCLRVFS